MTGIPSKGVAAIRAATDNYVHANIKGTPEEKMEILVEVKTALFGKVLKRLLAGQESKLDRAKRGRIIRMN